MKLTKSKNDEKKEATDLANDPTLVFLTNINSYKFNVGDILIKKTLQWDAKGEERVRATEVDSIGAPIKYVYAFENKIGVGYIKKLKNDGKGPTKANPVCITKVVQSDQLLQLDPDYADHLLFHSDEEFKYNARYERLKVFRAEAIEKNKALAVQVCAGSTESHDEDGIYDEEYIPSKAFKAFWKTIQVGELLYVGDSDIECLGDIHLEVVTVSKNGNIKFKILRDEWGWRDLGEEFSVTKKTFAQEYSFITKSKPYPLTEDNI